MKSAAVFTGSILFVLMVCSCATPYQPQGFRGGYSEALLDNDTFRVSFKGNSYTSSDNIAVYLLYRCAELTVQRGFDYFVIADSKAGTTEELVGPAGIPIHKHHATATIKLFKGSNSIFRNTYVAKELMDRLRAQVPDLAE